MLTKNTHNYDKGLNTPSPFSVYRPTSLPSSPSSTFIPTCSSLYTHPLLIRYPSALCQYPSPPPFYPSFPCHLPCTSYPPNHLHISITNNLSHMPLCLNLLTIHPKSHPPTCSTQQGQGDFYDWFIKMQSHPAS